MKITGNLFKQLTGLVHQILFHLTGNFIVGQYSSMTVTVRLSRERKN